MKNNNQKIWTNRVIKNKNETKDIQKPSANPNQITKIFESDEEEHDAFDDYFVKRVRKKKIKTDAKPKLSSLSKNHVSKPSDIPFRTKMKNVTEKKFVKKKNVQNRKQTKKKHPTIKNDHNNRRAVKAKRLSKTSNSFYSKNSDDDDLIEEDLEEGMIIRLTKSHLRKKTKSNNAVNVEKKEAKKATKKRKDVIKQENTQKKNRSNVLHTQMDVTKEEKHVRKKKTKSINAGNIGKKQPKKRKEVVKHENEPKKAPKKRKEAIKQENTQKKIRSNVLHNQMEVSKEEKHLKKKIKSYNDVDIEKKETKKAPKKRKEALKQENTQKKIRNNGLYNQMEVTKDEKKRSKHSKKISLQKNAANPKKIRGKKDANKKGKEKNGSNKKKRYMLVKKSKVTDITEEELPVYLKIFLEENVFLFDLALDIGGTNTRICFRPSDESKRHFTMIKLKFMCNDTHFLMAKLSFYAKVFQSVYGKKTVVDYACLSIAGCITSNRTDWITLGNYKKDFNMFRRKQLPKILFPLKKTFTLNDMDASSYAIIDLGKRELLGKYFLKENFFRKVKKVVQPNIVLGKNSYYVVNIGTGFGSSIIHYSEKTKDYEVIPFEFGRTKTFLPDNIEDERILKEISNINVEKFSNPEVLVTDVLSGGKGIVNIFKSLEVLKGNTNIKHKKHFSVEEIGEIMKLNTKVKMHLFKKIFLHAKQICIMFPNLKGIFFSGNNVKRNKGFILNEGVRNYLRNEFMNAPRSSWIENTKAFIQVISFNFNLHGCFYYIKEMRSKKGF